MVQTLDDARRRRPGGSGGGPRVPPHNLEAEESLLGAMLLSRDAIVSAVEIQLGAGDFYKPAHGHIFDAITSLYGQGEPADPVTVADELRRANLLDAVGGPQALVGLQANTPAIGNAGRYAHIVEEHSLLRRLIAVAGEIAEMGYSVPEDVAAAIDEAEALVFDVAQRRVTDSLSSLRDLLERHLDHIEALYERAEDITGVPTGFIDLDAQLAGLQPSNLVIVGGRPGTGKALGVATPIATPAGWTTMGELQVGDEVFDDRGQPCRVTYATPVMHDRPCYEVAFDDGSTLVADADHQWFAYDYPAWKSFRAAGYRARGPARRPELARDQSERRRRPRVVTTQQMLDEGLHAGTDGRPNWYIPLTLPLDLPEADLPADPYVLGCWLGDGKSSGSELTIGAEDVPHFRDELHLAGYGFSPRTALQYATVPIQGKGAWQSYRGPVRVLTRELQSVGLLGGASKHIPAAYLRASAKQRLALLQGLMDTDGTADKRHGVELCLSNPELIAQARELVCSLGHKPGQIRQRSVRLPDGRRGVAWRFGWTPLDPVFRLRRKAERFEAARARPETGRVARRAIVSIRPVPSVAVRCITVDAPSRLYLAGRSMIPTHNTSFALGIVSHAAVESRTPVLLFSLEMSHLELTQRMLCSEARVDATRMRNGRLLESDWPKIAHATGRLAEAPVFIDDNPHLTVMEIRAKARRLKSRSGLGLIVIDYLQLMTGRTNAENRQVEVSEISRGLKILARELEVPVVALSQLSRGLETRADKRPVLADLRESGCMPASTRIMRADNGEEIALGELVLTQQQPLLWSVDERQRLVPARLLKAFPTGRKPVFRLQLASGRSVDATANHPFLTSAGWRRLDALGAGSFIAVPRRVPAPRRPRTDVSDDELVLLAHMLGEGSMGPGLEYATADAANKLVVEETAERLFGIKAESTTVGRTFMRLFPSPYRLGHGMKHPMRNWLEPYGLWGAQGRTKFVPQPIFGLADDKVALFLHHLWATDGSITIGRNRRGPLVRTYYPTMTHRLALDVQRLLLRLGIRSSIGPPKKQRRQLHRIHVETAADQARLLETVGCYGDRARCMSEAFAILGVDEEADTATSDLSWDEVVGIVPVGVQPTFDLTVEGTHNFIADGVVAHNSLEQDADVVIFLYRDEVYNRDSPDRGTAEVIVAKHRNGPTGTTQLAFLDHYTRFANMAKGV